MELVQRRTKTLDANAQTIPNNMMLWQRLGDMQAGPETFNQQPCSWNPAIPLHLQKIALVKLRHFSQKRSVQQSYLGPQTQRFFQSKKRSFLVFKLYCIFFVQTSHVAKRNQRTSKVKTTIDILSARPPLMLLLGHCKSLVSAPKTRSLHVKKQFIDLWA